MTTDLSPAAVIRQRNENCPLCRGQARPIVTAHDRNRALTSDRFEYRRCRQCRAIFLVDVPEDLSRYYPESYYALPAPQHRESLLAAEAYKVGLLMEVIQSGRLVEVGAGYGVFAQVARDAGFDVTAIEMDEQMCEYLSDTVQVSAINSDAPEDIIVGLPPSNAVVLWHVLEHLPDPWEMLRRAAENLEPGGVLALSTPNPDSLQFRLLRSRWAHLDAPRHLFLIPPQTLAAKAAEFGLRPALLTSSDPAGIECNRLGWEYATLRDPAHRAPTRLTSTVAAVLMRASRLIESRPGSGSTYTAAFVKQRQ